MRRWVSWGVGAVAWAAASIAAILLALAFLPTIFGFETLIVASGSMGRTLPIGSVALTRAVEAEAITVGDVISFRVRGDTQTITHRVVAVGHVAGQIAFTTKGDANPAADPEKVVVGGRIHRVEQVVPLAGYVIRYARSPFGGIALIFVPIVGLILDRRSRHAHSAPRFTAPMASRKARRSRGDGQVDAGWSTTTYHLVRVTPKSLRSGSGG